MNKEQAVDYITKQGYTPLITNHRDKETLNIALDYLKNEDQLLHVSECRRDSCREYYIKLLQFHINDVEHSNTWM